MANANAPTETKYTFKVAEMDSFSMSIGQKQMSSSEIIWDLNLPCTSRTVWNILRTCDHIKRKTNTFKQSEMHGKI